MEDLLSGATQCVQNLDLISAGESYISKGDHSGRRRNIKKRNIAKVAQD
jgi:hypothetical protein